MHAQEAQKRVSNSLELELQRVLSYLMWCWANLGPPEEQQAFLNTHPAISPVPVPFLEMEIDSGKDSHSCGKSGKKAGNEEGKCTHSLDMASVLNMLFPARIIRKEESHGK